ncbi:sulfotransferase [Nocardia neocaledoniensis NBRC 108232]|uniref:Sulfotransferase family protein n=1 Tax=Nocardia neocaledoniensis TaxID=236511 RepID=A0A317NGC8_9NOCA|nr:MULTISPECIES: sulfotransferase [Nocardia]PWV74205.1 sulfotransferase family protein [Nocardia neocaledoniensis]UGT55656.1 sulfotransferase [Nocardia asteroides]GEM33988.1 sulfotransferase [Nocardia neocaledoniensis NBRC 108232]
MTVRTDVGTVADLHASATKLTGLTDFGADDYTEALQILLDSYREEAGLTELGSKMSRFFLRGTLVARALSEAAWAANPGYVDTPVTRPIFVTGLPRTGTTALHRLLAADPGNQGLEMWLTDFPQPRPPRDSWAENPAYQQIDAGLRQHQVQNPEFMGLHYMSAADVEECWQLLRQSGMSHSYECLAYVPGYSQWLSQQDWTPAYARHRRNLQLIGMNDDRRWVLKNPSHLFCLDALLAVYPDAVVIQTHRDPATIIPSVCSLNEHATRGWSTVFTGETIGRTQLDLWARGLSEFTAARARHPEATFLDIEFDDLRADPFAVVAGIYDRIGAEFTEQARAAIAALDSESRTGDRKPTHRYSLADYGLTEEMVAERFA